ncbi:MAG: putative DNA binding domain-containing protein [Candidatus Magnetomorum sp.]|nr:putative DNA binding domain-containing protein [Candidatus Magnetomorum sp.]
MPILDIQSVLQNGENSRVEFKSVSVSPKSLSEEIVAFLNVRGGVIYIGVEDDATITGIDILRKSKLEEAVMNVCRNNIKPPFIPDFETIKIDDQWIAKVLIPEGIFKPYSTVGGKYFVRVGSSKRISSREELLRLFQNAMILHIDDHPISGSSSRDLNHEKLKLFFKNVYELDYTEMNEAERETLLLNSSVLAPFDSQICATIAGLLFFAEYDSRFPVLQKFLPHTGIQFVAYETPDMDAILDRFECFEDCPTAIESIIHKLRINWKIPSKIIGLIRQEQTFPLKVFRELIVNAVVHRDYSIQSKINVRMFPDRIEIITPGRLANTVTVEKMKAGISVPRNPILIKFMQNFRYADQLGRGIPMIMKALEEMPGFNIILEEKEDQFYAVIEYPVV